MIDKISLFFDQFSEFFAHRKGLLPLIGIVLVLFNFVLQVFPLGWVSSTNCFLHLGIVLAFVGFMMARAL